MTEPQDELSPRERSAETKKRRTRERLINAADFVLREDGLDARVESIAQEAGVSAPTFYNFYRSRNDLCGDAVNELIMVPLKRLPHQAVPTPIHVVVHLLLLAEGREQLIRAALAGRLEHSPRTGLKYVSSFLGGRYVAVEDADFVEELAAALSDTDSSVPNLRATALYLLDQLAQGATVVPDELGTLLAIPKA